MYSQFENTSLIEKGTAEDCSNKDDNSRGLVLEDTFADLAPLLLSFLTSFSIYLTSLTQFLIDYRLK